MELNIENPIIVREEKVIPEVKTGNIILLSFTDFPDLKKVSALISIPSISTKKSIVIWRGEAYDSAGDYSHQEVLDRTVAAITLKGFDPTI